MPKPDPALLDPARYPFHCQIETRYRDLDSNLHINNGVFASLLEEGRVRFHRASQFGGGSDGTTAMIVSVGIEYLGESHFPEPLDMHVGAERIGNSSYDLCQLVMQGARRYRVCQGDAGLRSAGQAGSNFSRSSRIGRSENESPNCAWP